MFFKLIKVHLYVSELYIFKKALCKKKFTWFVRNWTNSDIAYQLYLALSSSYNLYVKLRRFGSNLPSTPGVSTINRVSDMVCHNPLYRSETDCRFAAPAAAINNLNNHIYSHRWQHLRHMPLLSFTKTKLKSVALVRERTIPIERPPPVGEISANFCG